MTYGMTWYQPREQKFYGPGLVRITKNMTLSYYSINPTGALEEGGTGANDITTPCLDEALGTQISLNNKGFVLTGASALIYGASIAFGATAMAFI